MVSRTGARTPGSHRFRWVLIAAGVVIVLLTVAGTFAWRRATVPARYPVDLLVSYGDNAESLEVWPAGTGRHLTAGLSVYRVPDGWLLDGGERLLRPDGTQTRLITHQYYGGLGVAPDGRGLAWRSDKAVWVGRLVHGRLVHRRHRPMPRSSALSPDLYSGSAVHLTNAHEPDATWVPGVGLFQDRKANPAVRKVVDVAPDRRHFIGVVASKGHRCLALLDPAHRLRTVRKRCLPGDAMPTVGGVSPHGRNVAVRSGHTIRVYRWATVFGSAHAIAAYSGQPHNPYIQDLFWITDMWFAVATDYRKDTCDVARTYRLGHHASGTIRLPARTMLTALRDQTTTTVSGYPIPRFGV